MQQLIFNESILSTTLSLSAVAARVARQQTHCSEIRGWLSAFSGKDSGDLTRRVLCAVAAAGVAATAGKTKGILSHSIKSIADILPHALSAVAAARAVPASEQLQRKQWVSSNHSKEGQQESTAGIMSGRIRGYGPLPRLPCYCSSSSIDELLIN